MNCLLLLSAHEQILAVVVLVFSHFFVQHLFVKVSTTLFERTCDTFDNLVESKPSRHTGMLLIKVKLYAVLDDRSALGNRPKVPPRVQALKRFLVDRLRNNRLVERAQPGGG